MFTTHDIHSLTDFTRHAREHIDRLKDTGRPEVLTVNGKASVVVQDADAYQKLLDLVDAAETIEAVKASMAAFERGEGRDAMEALDDIRRRHAIPRSD